MRLIHYKVSASTLIFSFYYKIAAHSLYSTIEYIGRPSFIAFFSNISNVIFSWLDVTLITKYMLFSPLYF